MVAGVLQVEQVGRIWQPATAPSATLQNTLAASVPLRNLPKGRESSLWVGGTSLEHHRTIPSTLLAASWQRQALAGDRGTILSHSRVGAMELVPCNPLGFHEHCPLWESRDRRNWEEEVGGGAGV